MSDGPFKNTKLSSWWKGYMEALVSDAVNDEERLAEAAHAVLGDILTNSPQALFSHLRALVDCRQLDLEAATSIEAIFDSHEKTPFADRLQNEMAYQLANNETPKSAFAKGLEKAVRLQVEGGRTRAQEECIRAVDTGKMTYSACDHAIKRINSDINRLDVNQICEAALANDKRAFKRAIRKKVGLEEGPDL